MSSSTPRLTIVVARDRIGTIGKDGDLPWHLPRDLAHFKRITAGGTVLMGRATHASIGRPLPKRRNIVLSRNPNYAAAGCEIFPDPRSALAALANEEEVFLIGGATLYEQLLPEVTRMHLTEVDTEVEGGDAFFPALDDAAWRETSRESIAADEKNAIDMIFRTLERVTPVP